MKDGQTIAELLNWNFEIYGDLEINDKNGKLIYWERSDGYWAKWERDSQGNQIYYENSDGEIKDHSIPAIIEHNGHKYQLIP